MIPAALAALLTRGARDFLRHSFESTTPGFAGAIDRLLDDGETPLMRGPYVSLRLPFRAAVEGEGLSILPALTPPLSPHRHQALAWARLSGQDPHSTLVATGTGSGKTECFLWPILDHCLRARQAGQTGIKAILLYPMNALATDQSGRIAQAIWRHPSLRGQVTAGLYIGEDTSARSVRHAEMGEHHLVTDRGTMQKSPPDILLTNYKMLDFLLLRAEDQGLWARNAPGTLRYLVVDELHTFDGAQGTDLACLIRRVKHRLGCAPGGLCCVGTSATLGGEGTSDALLAYAHDVFGEAFEAHAGLEPVVGESRISLDEFLRAGEGGDEPGPTFVREPSPADLEVLDPVAGLRDHAPHLDGAAARLRWARAQIPLWFGDETAAALAPDTPEGAVALGVALCRHATFRELMRALENCPGGLAGLGTLVLDLARARRDWRENADFGCAALGSLLGLVSVARAPNPTPGKPPRPFLEVRVQLWQRELSRVVGLVAELPRLRLADDLDPHELSRHLPVVHCRDCGAMGWGARVDTDAPTVLRSDLSAFYKDFFSGRDDDARIRFAFPEAAASGLLQPRAAERRLVDTEHLVLLDPGSEARDGQRAVGLVLPPCHRRDDDGKVRLDRDCPFCGAQASLALVGFRAATLTSAQIDQLYGSRFNADKKLLAFSDAVQDAAHRAGFFGARTWQGTLRSGIARFVAALGEGLTLAELPEAFARHETARLGEVGFISTYLPPSMDWLQDWEQIRASGTLPPPPSGADDDTGKHLPLTQLVAKRLRWEFNAQIGFQSGIGRSLIETGALGVAVDRGRLDAAVTAALEPVRNEVPGMRTLSREVLRGFVLGLVHLMRARGAIDHAELPAEFRASRGDKLYWLNRQIHLPKYGRSSRLPRFLTDRGGSARADQYVGGVYAGWFHRALAAGRHFELTSGPGDLYAVLLPRLVRSGLLTLWEADGGAQVFAVADSSLRLTGRIARVVCERCHGSRPVAEAEATFFHGMACPRTGCVGTYRLITGEAEPDYFGRLYLDGEGQRVFAAEHTALVPRERREETERSFKARPAAECGDSERPRQAWDVNLLSCTPTLEMGIDIGDLSSVFLCGVPRSQANYVQRVGRAGRRDGNALVLTLAAARPHDRYFFEAPEEMMAGAVAPPGVFLGAARVLERQLHAFALDRWVQAGAGKHSLPPRMARVFARLPKSGSTHAVTLKPSAFPEGFVEFVHTQRASLLEEFTDLFVPPLEAQVIAVLHASLHGSANGQGDFGHELLRLFYEERKSRDALNSTAKAARKEAEKIEKAIARPLDWQAQHESLEQEADAHARLVEEIDDRSTLEFLVERGWLPNYAFPEDAVTLRSIIWRRLRAPIQRPDGRTKNHDARTFEYQRAPAIALTELAPDAEFYAEGRRVRITQVDLSAQPLENWRLCSECSHAALDQAASEHATCPACGSSQWGDTGQRFTMVRLTQVKARTADADSRIRDDADERAPRYFERRMFVDVRRSPEDIAFRVESPSCPFGFELLRRVEFREINFGRVSDTAEKRRVGGRDAPRAGFRLCRHCGVVLRKLDPARRRPREQVRHEFGCKYFSDPTIEPPASDLVDALFLYRSFTSEAVRLLLPLSDLGQEVELDSFRAAMRLGLRRFFQGRVDHVQFTFDSEPVEDSRLRRTFLVLYDAVPGGTSYLRQLVEPHGGAPGLMTVLRLALDGLQACPCRPGEDGCYRCLRAHADGGGRRPVSKRAAIELLQRLLDAAQTGLVAVDTLSEVSVDGLLDSVLEARFIEALSALAKKQGDGSRVEKTVVGGQMAYRIFASERAWTATPQVELGDEDGVVVPSRADFVLTPTVPLAGECPIAIYLDGWAFHNRRIGLDMAQRMAIQDSLRFDTYSLTWQDVDEALAAKGLPPVPPIVSVDAMVLDDLLRKAGNAGAMGLLSRSPCVTLWETMRRSVTDKPANWSEAGALVLSKAVEGAMQSGGAVAPMPALSEPARADLGQFVPPGLADTLLDGMRLVLRQSAKDGRVQLRFAVSASRRLRPLVWLDDRSEAQSTPDFREVWRAYLRLHQALRAVAGAVFVTASRGPDVEKALAALVEARALPAMMGWAEDLDLPADCRPLATVLSRAGAPAPAQGIELPDTRGRIWAEAELVFESARVAIVRRPAFEHARGEPSPDWTIIVADAPDATARVLAALGLTDPGEMP